MLVIACLSQKGGVGKSTLARLIATTYCQAGWKVKIADFNVKQKTCLDWSLLRERQNIAPLVPAEAYNDPVRALKDNEDHDMIVFDGKPDSDTQTIRIAQESDVVIIPTGVSADDLVPQVRFAQELKQRGIHTKKILFVINKATESNLAIEDARNFIEAAGFENSRLPIYMKTAYINAQNTGRCISETEFATLNARSTSLAQDIVNHVQALTQVPA